MWRQTDRENLGVLRARISKYRPASWAAASSGMRGISCTELSCALSISRRNGVVPIGNDVISPRGAMTKIVLGFADPANPWLRGNIGTNTMVLAPSVRKPWLSPPKPCSHKMQFEIPLLSLGLILLSPIRKPASRIAARLHFFVVTKHVA